MYKIKATRTYKKSLKKLSHAGLFDRKKIEKVVDVLAEGKKLTKVHKDHSLVGKLKGFRECHISSDLLLIYYKQDKQLVLVLVDIGSHSKLFG